MKLAVLALLGYVSAEKLVQCPFGHRHEHHDHQDGEENGDGEHHHHHHHHGHWFHKHHHGEHKKFGIPQNSTDTMSYELDSEHQGCPFMHFIYENMNKLAQLERDDMHKNREHHETPFYELEENEETGEFIPNPEGNGVPTAVFHGFGDACINPGDIQFNRMIAAGTNAKVHCIEVGVPSLGEVFNNFETIAQKSCQEIIANKDFQGEFNVVGLSQGGLLARYIAEECEMPGKVRNVLTLGGPHMGVDAIPGCFTGIMCNIVNFLAKQIVYTSFAQNWFAPAGYFRNVQRYNEYIKGSTFLPALNNEHATKGELSALRKSSFSSINQAMLVMFEQDSVIYPKESAWFQSLGEDGKTVLPLNATAFYQQDYIGVKELNEAGKIQFVSIDGDHLQFSQDDIKNTFIPFLNE